MHVCAHGGGVGALVKCLEKGYLCDRIAFAGSQIAAMAALPGSECGIVQQNRNTNICFAIGRDVEDVFGAGGAVAMERAMAFIVILINISRLSGICFLTANGGRPGQRLRLWPEPTIQHNFDYPGTDVLLTSAKIGVKMRVESAGDDSDLERTPHAGFC